LNGMHPFGIRRTSELSRGTSVTANKAAKFVLSYRVQELLDDR